MAWRQAVLTGGFVIAAAFSAPALAQQEDEQLWLQVNTNLPLSEKVRITLEQIARFSDRQDGLYQTEIGGLLGFRIAKGVELGFGYRRVEAHNGNTAADEDRLRQQIVGNFGPVTMRLRVDERFHPAGKEIGFRIRPLLRYNYRLKPNGLTLFASHESFILPNSTRWGQRAGYERMRNIVGVAVPLGKRVVADIGYLNQFRPGRSGAPDQMDHALNIQLTINLKGFVGARVHD
jgi:hypothetical protein